ncbi:MAG: hypothetical protein ACQEVA_19245 [Myxococcota bacterium]
MRAITNIFLALVVVGTMLGFADTAAAQDVDVTVRSISASKDGNNFDPKLNDLKNKLTRAFSGYTSFKLVQTDDFTLDKSQAETVTVPGGTEVTLTFHGLAGDFYKMGLSIADKLTTTLRASPKSTFFQAGLSYKSGILILAITVE